MDASVRGREAVVGRHLAKLHGEEIAAVECDGPSITGGHVAETVSQRHRDGERLGDHRRARDGQAKACRRRRGDLHRQASGDTGLGGVDGADRLRPRPVEGGGEAARAIGQGRVRGQHHPG